MIRFVAMILIVTCHMMQFYGNELAWWFNVGVQIFFVMSGFLYGGKNIGATLPFILKQFKKMLIPYYLFLFPCLFIYALYARENLSLFSVIRAFFLVGVVDGIGHLWFVGYILFCYLLTPYLEIIRNRIQGYSMGKSAFIWIVIIGVYCIIGELISFYFRPERVCCYLIGYAIASLINEDWEKRYKFIMISFIVLAIVFIPIKIYALYFCELTSLPLFERLYFMVDGYIHMLLGVSLFLLMLLSFNTIRENRILAFSDCYSYPIYIVHQLFILSPFTLMCITNHHMFNWIFVLASIGISAFVLQRMSNYILNKKY